MTELGDYLRAELEMYESKRPLRQKAAMEASEKRERELKDAYAEGFKAGQEEMRECVDLLKEADAMLTTAQRALRKLGLHGRGSDVSLSSEVREYSYLFSMEERTGPGILQVRGSGKCLELRNRIRELIHRLV